MRRALHTSVFGWLIYLSLGGALLSDPAHAEDEALWRAIRGGEHVVLMRHALAPGTGDPVEFDVRDCATQRNLSPEGREQAARIGERLRRHGVNDASVYSSQWCRCLDTATALGLGEVRELPIANSFFRRFERREAQTVALREWIRNVPLTTPLIVVTHQVNITALTEVFPASGEMVVVRRQADGSILVAGRLQTQ